MSNLQDLYFGQIKDLYDAEHQLLEALPKMAEQAQSPKLKDAFKTHLKETEEQVERLEAVFANHDMEPERETCKAMKGLIAEGDHEMKEWKKSPAVCDAAMIASAQRVEHYEIAGYGSAKCFAEILGFTDDVSILDEILEEEKNADEILNDVAMSSVNRDALLAEEGGAEGSQKSSKSKKPSDPSSGHARA